MKTASFKRAAESADPYTRWQFTNLSVVAPTKTDGRDTSAAAALEQLRQKARHEGYAAGFSAGRGDGRAAAEAEATHLRRLAASLAQAQTDFKDEVAPALLALAVDIAGHVLRAELAHNPQAMLPALREAMDLAGGGAHPQMLLNPGDLEFVRRHLGDDLAPGAWRLIEDGRIEPGGCRVLTANGAVDATLATRWQRAAAALGVTMPAPGVTMPALGVTMPAAGMTMPAPNGK